MPSLKDLRNRIASVKATQKITKAMQMVAAAKQAILDSLKQELAACVMTDEAINILRKYGLDKAVMAEMTRRIQAVMEGWSGGRMQVEIVVFSNVHGELGRTGKALEYMRLLQEQLRAIE